jgi:putative acetyltransferase
VNYKVQRIEVQHDMGICKVIKQVGEEYGAIGQGYGPSDPEVEMMSQFYIDDYASRYFVVSVDEIIVGGGGIASFNGRNDVCELRKLFLLPEWRGLGLGKQVTEYCLQYAKSKGYKKCYLDTLSRMKGAISLYEKFGFKHLTQPLQGTIHSSCDVWMLKEL